jgi:hypothetical protein
MQVAIAEPGCAVKLDPIPDSATKAFLRFEK